MLAQSFGDNRLRRFTLDSGFSRCARLVAGRPNGVPRGRRVSLPVAGRIAHRGGPAVKGCRRCSERCRMLDLFIVKSISYLGCFRAILSLHEIDLGCLGCSWLFGLLCMFGSLFCGVFLNVPLVGIKHYRPPPRGCPWGCRGGGFLLPLILLTMCFLCSTINTNIFGGVYLCIA
jgi:hypothetical protein